MLVLAGWLVLARARRGLRRHGVAAAGSLAVIGLLLPPDNMLRSSELFSPGAFALPGPIELSLGRVLGVAAAGALGIGLLAGPARPPLPAWAVALAVTAFFPVLASVMHAGASPGFLAGAETGWVGFEVALALLPTLGAAVPLCVARAPEPRRRASWALVCALGLAALLSGCSRRGRHRHRRTVLVGRSVGGAGRAGGPGAGPLEGVAARAARLGGGGGARNDGGAPPRVVRTHRVAQDGG